MEQRQFSEECPKTKIAQSYELLLVNKTIAYAQPWLYIFIHVTKPYNISQFNYESFVYRQS